MGLSYIQFREFLVMLVSISKKFMVKMQKHENFSKKDILI